MKRISYFILLLVAIASCEETVLLDIDQTPVRIVIDGLVTNESKQHAVKVSRTVDFYQQGLTPRVEDAVVSVSDNEGNVFNYVHNPNNHPDSVGFYLSEFPFAGEVGRIYTLNVQADGQTYTALDSMFRVTSVDSLEITINEDERMDPEDEDRFYEILYYAEEPQDTKDFYLFQFFRNGELENEEGEQIYFADDRALGDRIDALPIPVFYALGDTAVVETFSLTRNGFLFYNDLFNNINNDGGMFSPPPANPRTNLTNGALGFFQVSAINRLTLVIEE
ncbi:MAG: DUF4249 family protein [Bacteroidota bacterium]